MNIFLVSQQKFQCRRRRIGTRYSNDRRRINSVFTRQRRIVMYTAIVAVFEKIRFNVD